MAAYACDPGSGSEGSYGWNYSTELARRGHEVHVLVASRWRDRLRQHLLHSPVDRLSFHYVDEPRLPMRFGWSVGNSLRYVAWQRRASAVALTLDRLHGFDVVHHVSYGTLLGGSYLWRLGKPLVFGPTGGGQTTPWTLLPYFGRDATREIARTLVTRYLWVLDRPAVETARAAAVILTSNPETAALARRMGARRVESMPDVHLADHLVAGPRTPADAHPVRLLWVGRFLGRKGQRLTVEALDLVPPDVDVTLDMVGDGPLFAEFHDWLEASVHPHAVTLRGRIPWADVLRAYGDADVFVFTPLRESAGAQFLEAMAHSLPVIALDHQGASVLVTREAGLKVPVASMAVTRRGVADAIARLSADAQLRASFGAGARSRALEFTLTRRVDRLEAIYRQIVAGQ